MGIAFIQRIWQDRWCDDFPSSYHYNVPDAVHKNETKMFMFFTNVPEEGIGGAKKLENAGLLVCSTCILGMTK